jgi:hypothetical protein
MNVEEEEKKSRIKKKCEKLKTNLGVIHMNNETQ